MNNKPRVLFIRIPKTGSTSIRTALNISDIHGHQTLAFFQEHDIEYDYSFAFVRNTYTRLVSWYRFHHGHEIDGFRKWIKAGCTTDWDDDWIASWQDNTPLNQMIYIKNKDGEIDIDFIGFFENINDDFLELCNQLNINPPQLTKIIPKPSHEEFNKTEFRYDAKEYYDDETKEKVDELFKEEINYFNFKFFK